MFKDLANRKYNGMSFILRIIALMLFLLGAFLLRDSLAAMLVPLGLGLWVGSTLFDNPWNGRPVV
jgi:hypothetical protein